MITNLSMRNFKAFEDLELDLKRLTILAGCNSSGKSTILQAIRLLGEQYSAEEQGALRDYIRYSSLSFDLSCKESSGELISFKYTRSENQQRSESHINSLISYISADRYGPRLALPYGLYGVVDTVGERGEKLIDFLSQLETSFAGLRVPDKLTINGGTGIRSNLQEWLRLISPNVKFDFSFDKNSYTGATEFNKHKSIHAGYGLSYALPLIISILVHAAQITDLDYQYPVVILAENPEAHLHPGGQTMIGRMLTLGAACGLQIIVETHSDHLLNGIRIAIKEELLKETESKILYFETNALEELPDETSYASCTELQIDKYGMIDQWPKGFFDETENSLLKLI